MRTYHVLQFLDKLYIENSKHLFIYPKPLISQTNYNLCPPHGSNIQGSTVYTHYKLNRIVAIILFLTQAQRRVLT